MTTLTEQEIAHIKAQVMRELIPELEDTPHSDILQSITRGMDGEDAYLLGVRDCVDHLKWLADELEADDAD